MTKTQVEVISAGRQAGRCAIEAAWCGLLDEIARQSFCGRMRGPFAPSGGLFAAPATVVACFFGSVAGTKSVDVLYGPSFWRNLKGPLQACHLRLLARDHASDHLGCRSRSRLLGSGCCAGRRNRSDIDHACA